MSSGKHAGFMGGEGEGAPALGDPGHCDGCLRVFPEVWSPPTSRFPRVGLAQTPAGGSESWRGKGSEGRRGGWHVRSAHLRCSRDTASCLWPARDYFGK